MGRPLTPEDLWTLPRVGRPAPVGGGTVVVPVTEHDIEENRAASRLWLVSTGSPPRPLTAAGGDASKPVVPEPSSSSEESLPGETVPPL